jgi:hypothetical protein
VTDAVNDGQTTPISAAYTQQTGALRVTITPAAVVSAGAQWRIAGTTTWRNSGATQTGIAVGQATVEFKPVTGWATPANVTDAVNDGQTTPISAAYTQQTGSLTVTLAPSEAVSAGARWRVDDGAWFNSGDTQSNLTVGEHSLQFENINGWTSPGSQNVMIADGQTATINTTYTQQPGSGGGSSPGDDNDSEGDDGSTDPGDDDGGTPDNQQGNVVEFNTYDNRHQVTLTSPAGTTIRDYRAMQNPDSDGSPERVDFSYGFFEFTVDGLEPGSATTVTVDLPAGESQDTYYKYGPTDDNRSDHWYEFLYDGRTGAEINGNRITLHFVDGQRGDDDLQANGIVTDIGGPGVTIVGPSGGNNNPPQSADSPAGGGGGCFIELLRTI